MSRCAKRSAPLENSKEWAEWYIDAVLKNKIVCCKWVKKCIERHKKDLKRYKLTAKYSKKATKLYYFDENAGESILKAFNEYRHYKGKWAGQRFILLPWQQALLYIVFGWRNRATGFRRFRTVYIEVARKNGKSTLAAGVGLYMLDLDGEPGAEVVSAATQREQAKIVHEAAKQMVKNSLHLKKYIKTYKDSLVVEDTVSTFKPLSSDYNTLDGLNISCAIIDELHAHKTRDLYDVLDTATGARQQPMILSITTAGVSQQSICREMHDYTENLLNDVITDDTFFGIIYTLDDGDDWTDPKVWIKANPSLGESIDPIELADRCRKAQNSSDSRNAFLRLRMNMWTSNTENWVTPEDWAKGGVPIELDSLKGRECYVGMDLSSVSDLTAVCLLFQMDDGKMQALWQYYLPAENITEKCRLDRVPYDQWARDGYITLTPGAAVDYDFIEHDILTRFAVDYKIKELAFDPYNAAQLTAHLVSAGLNCIISRQGMLSLSPPTKGLQVQIMSGNFIHGDNPVTNWMIGNCEVQTDAAGNTKLVKSANVKRRKIDGLVAAVMAFSRVDIGTEQPSVYEERGIRTL